MGSFEASYGLYPQKVWSPGVSYRSLQKIKRRFFCRFFGPCVSLNYQSTVNFDRQRILYHSLQRAQRLCTLPTHTRKQSVIASKKNAKGRQHPDFPGGHPPEYYPSLRLLNFADRTGYGALSLRWPSTKGNVAQVYLNLYTVHTTTHNTQSPHTRAYSARH